MDVPVDLWEAIWELASPEAPLVALVIIALLCFIAQVPRVRNASAAHASGAAQGGGC